MPRSINHDYRSRCIYHITLKKAPGIPPFGTLCGEVPDVSITRSKLGCIIERHIRNINRLNSLIRVLQYIIMPDHIHMLIFVTSPVDLPIGNYIGKFKVMVFHEYSNITGQKTSVFEDDFHDCILHAGRSLDTIFKYIRSNPYRLAVRRQFPDYFKRINNLIIGNRTYQSYGNQFLIKNPFKEQVVVHHSDSLQEHALHRTRWLHIAANGGVLVSPFISQPEKKIRHEAEALKGNIILITHLPFKEFYKPDRHEFELCTEGRLLIIAPVEKPANTHLSRETCINMNKLANEIVSML